MQNNTIEKLTELLTKDIDPKELAKCLRRFKHIAIVLLLEQKEELADKNWVTDGHYWLTRFEEILDPQLIDD